MNELDIEYLKMKLESQSLYVGGERDRSMARGDTAAYPHLDMLYLKLLSCIDEANALMGLIEEGKAV